MKCIYLHCVFHGIRFKVNNEDWLSVTDSLFFAHIFRQLIITIDSSSLFSLLLSKHTHKSVTLYIIFEIDLMVCFFNK